MPYQICKTIEIENGHMLSKREDNCRFPHGHSRRIEIVVRSDATDAGGMVCDFKVLKKSVAEYFKKFDHALCMNTSDPMYASLKQAYGEHIVGFEATEPTSEILAYTFFRAVDEIISSPDFPKAPGAKLVRLRVQETATSWAEYGL